MKKPTAVLFCSFTIDSPSEIQRVDDLVGMEMPTRPLPSA